MWPEVCFLKKDMKLKTGFGDYSADGLAHLGETVATNLPTLAVFAALKPTPAQITAAVEGLTAAMAMIGPGRRQAIATAFRVLADLLGEVATNAPQVTGATDTDLAQIGLPPVKTPTRVTSVPGVCENLRLRHGTMPGAVAATCKPPADNIRLYESQYTLDPSAEWTNGESSPNSRAFLLTELPRGKDIWIRVRAINTIGAGPWSDPATIMVT